MNKKSNKILFINTSDCGGGAARAAYRILKGLQSKGVDAKFFVKSKGYSDDPTITSLDEYIPKNAVYKLFSWVRSKIKNKIQHYRWGRYPNREDVYMSDMRSTAIHNAISSSDCDIIHLHWVNQRFLPLDQLVKSNKPIVWTLHDSWAFCGVCHYFYNCDGYKYECGNCPLLHSEDSGDLSHRVWKQKLAIYSKLNIHVVAPSRWLAACAKESSLFKRFPVSVIPNCIDTQTYLPVEREDAISYYNLDANKRYILYGAMNAVNDRNKGFKELLKALKGVVEPLAAKGVELLIFGSDEPIEELNIGLPVHSLGVLKQEEALVMAYNAADIMVVPSLSENLSCAIMESLSCATPVVCFNIGGNSDMVEHKINGYLAQERDCNDLADGIIWTLEQDKTQLGQNGRQRVLDNYSIDVVSRCYAELYEGVK